MCGQSQPIEDAATAKQGMRLFDILIFSPILLYIGISGKLNMGLRTVLVILGITTILYNGYYYLKYSKNK